MLTTKPLATGDYFVALTTFSTTLGTETLAGAPRYINRIDVVSNNGVKQSLYSSTTIPTGTTKNLQIVNSSSVKTTTWPLGTTNILNSIASVKSGNGSTSIVINEPVSSVTKEALILPTGCSNNSQITKISIEVGNAFLLGAAQPITAISFQASCLPAASTWTTGMIALLIILIVVGLLALFFIIWALMY